MLPETLDNGLRSPNNNTGMLPRNRASLCLSPLAAAQPGLYITQAKRRSWCGTPTGGGATTPGNGRRYGELGLFRPRNDHFLEPHCQFIDRQSPEDDPPSSASERNPFSSALSRSLSRESLDYSNGGSEGGSEDSENTGYGAACDITLLERLQATTSIWFLPGIQRAGAVHLLQGKEEGCFVVRQSSQPNTMALSVRLPPDKNPYIEHYLIQSNEGQVGLETSEHRFDGINMLIAHYANCCDELPVQLALPRAVREARSRQQLSSMALLGQEFWRYSPPVSPSSPDADVVVSVNNLSTFKAAEPATPIGKPVKPIRPNTLDLNARNKQPPPPPPRTSKPGTPQNNITVTTTFTISMNSPRSENIELAQRMSPEAQTSSHSLSSKSSRKEQITSPTTSILSPNSDSVLSDTLSPLSKTTSRHSKRKTKISKHYQESDILDSPTIYNRSTIGDKISDYEDVWTNDQPKSRHHFNSPDLLQHVLNNNLESPEMQQISPKQGSPFYAEPADSLPVNLPNVPRRLVNRGAGLLQQRHSNPPILQGVSMNERLDASDCNDISSSVDNLTPKPKKSIIHRQPDVRLSHFKLPERKFGAVGGDTWQVDDGWRFMGNDADVSMDSSDLDGESDWPATMPNLPLTPFSPTDDENGRRITQEMISKRFPNLRHSELSTTVEEECRMSAYDNVEDKRIPRPPPSEISELTEFSDPWNETTPGLNETDDTEVTQRSASNCNRTKSFRDRMDPLISADRICALRTKETESRTVGVSIRSYALELAKEKSTTFAQNIDNFIACTCDSKETNPQVVMRNMRQFMSGMKNYLVKHGEKGFDKEVERERNKLRSTEFLNLDAILEGVLHLLVVKPLRGHLDQLFKDHYTKNGALKLLTDNIQYAGTRPHSELAIKPKIILPNETALKTIKGFFGRLQEVDSPLEKLEYLLAAIATIFNSVKNQSGVGSRPMALGADDFLPLFVWVLVRTKFDAAEIEAEYMWGLLHPSLLSGEGGYYLTTLSSAVHVLKNFKTSSEEHLTSVPKTDCVLKVVVPDELHGSILTKTLPARPQMTTKEVCKIIAHKARITNPQDFALYRLINGEETMLGDNECPQEIIQRETGHVTLAYKRIDAKIAWPRQH